MTNKSFCKVLLTLLLTAVPAICQTNDYDQTNLVSDIPGMAAHTDPKLINPWGISFLPGQPFWIADNNSGFSTLYDSAGNSQQPTVLIPPPGGSTASATPTGTVANSTSGFVVGTGPSLFLFDTEDGTISGWNGVGTNAILAVDHSGIGAVYKGLAMINTGNASFLLATNFNSGKVEVYDSAFQAATLAGSFSDPTLPAGYAPFGIQVIGSQVFVTYALQDTAKHDPIDAPGNGFVNIFDFSGNLVKRFASNGTLNSPWGVAQAPSGFGVFAGAILVGNFGDGTINAFDAATGNFLGQMQDGSGNVITNSGLWALVFGGGGTGNLDTLYFTAGLAGESHGLFGSLDVGSGGGAGSDFSIAASPQSATVRAGQSTQFMISVSPLNGFTGTVNFSCAAPAGISCSFTPGSVNATGTAASTTMNISTASSGPHYGPMALWMGLSGTGLFGFVTLGGTKRRKRTFSLLAGGIVCLALAGTMLSSVGCGGGSSTASRGTASVAVTATSATLTHTTMVSLTVN